MRNDISTLNNQFEDMKTILQNTKENCLQLEMELSQTTASRDSEIATREQAIAEKDDLIRTLKQKLENAPEDITVAMPTTADDVAHQQTKNELAALKEKCKKLIVKVGYIILSRYALLRFTYKRPTDSDKFLAIKIGVYHSCE